MNGRVVRYACAAGVTAALAAGCGSAGAVPAAAERAVVVHVTCSLAVVYHSLTGLRRAATTVALIRPAAAGRVRWGAGGPTTLTTVRVLRRLAGRPLPGAVRIVDLAAPGVVGDDVCFPAVSARDLYVAFLTPFRLSPRSVLPGRYALAGDAQGLYVHRGLGLGPDAGSARFTRVGPAAGPGGGPPTWITLRRAARS